MSLLLALLLSCSGDETPEDPSIVDLFQRLQTQGSLSASEIEAVERFMDVYHRQTTLHCDEIWRRSSADGLRFSGPGERILRGASVADVAIDNDGSHVLVYNDTRTGRLVETLRSNPSLFWAQGLVGFGGIGLSRLKNGQLKELALDLHLDTVQEAVDPDLGIRADGTWRLVWFGVEPGQMNAEQHGPLASSKPHHFYRSQSASLGDFI